MWTRRRIIVKVYLPLSHKGGLAKEATTLGGSIIKRGPRSKDNRKDKDRQFVSQIISEFNL